VKSRSETKFICTRIITDWTRYYHLAVSIMRF